MENIYKIAFDFFSKIAKASEDRYEILSKDHKVSSKVKDEAKDRMNECSVRAFIAAQLYCDYLEEKAISQNAELWRLKGGCLRIATKEDIEEAFSLKNLNKNLTSKERCYDD